MNNKKRLKFKCWKCQEEYTQLVTGYVKIVVECPYCEQEATVDLTPYGSSIVSAYKGGDSTAIPLDLETLTLPDVIPTVQMAG